MYKVNRQSLKTRHKFWLGTKQGRVIPNKVAITEELANELSKVYHDLDMQKASLEAEREKLFGIVQEKRLLLKRIKTKGPVSGVKFRNTVRGIGEHNELVEIQEVWEWKNVRTSPGEDVDPQLSDVIHLISWEPDLYRPQSLERTRLVTPSEAQRINRVLQEEDMLPRQVEAQIDQLENRAEHLGTQLSAVIEQLDLPLTLKEGS